MPDDHRPRSVSRLSRTRPPGCVRRLAYQARLRVGTWVQIIAVDLQNCRPLTDAHRPRSACRNVRTWPPGCVRFFVSRTISWSSRSSRQFLPERLGQFLRGKVPARRQRSGEHLGIQKKKGSRKETPAIRNHWFDKMHQSADGGAWPAGTQGRQRSSSISSNHHERMVGMNTGQQFSQTHPPSRRERGLAETETRGGGPTQATGRKCSPTQSSRATAGCPHPRWRTDARASRQGHLFR